MEKVKDIISNKIKEVVEPNKEKILSDEDMNVLAQELGHKVVKFFQNKQQQINHVAESCENAIKERPFASTGLAFAAGALFAMLLIKRK